MAEANADNHTTVAPDDAFLCPASPNQQALWFIDRLQPGQATYNIATAFALTGPVRWDLIQNTIDILTDRHESLRTSFATVDGAPMQVIAPRVDVPLRHVDLTSAADATTRMHALIEETAREPFDMSAGPLLRARGISLAPDNHALIVVMHHSISDGWSLAVYFAEFGAIYRALATGAPVALPEVPIQYADYCLWQEQRLTSKLVDQQLAYWREVLAGAADGLELPADGIRPLEPSHRGDCVWFDIDRRTAERLTQFCRGEGITTFVALVAVLDMLLQRYTGRDDITIGTPVAGRSRAELEATVGFITNTVVVRTTLAGDPTFRGLLARVRERSMGAQQHQDVPFTSVVDALQPERTERRNPLFSVMCAVQRVPDTLLDLGSDIAATVLQVHSGTSKFDWLWEFQERDGSIEGSLEFSTDRFSRAFASRATDHFRILLDAALNAPDRRLSTFDLLSSDERAQQRGWNDTTVARAPRLTVVQMFDTRVAAAPDRPAFRHGDQTATYGELSNRAWQCARALRDRGVEAGDRVGLLMERSGSLLVALLAVLRSGAAYVPMDPAYPADRLRYMADDADLACIVTDGNATADGWHDQEALLRLPAWDDVETSAVPPIDHVDVSPASPCYVMYTSGSTGRPKGVVMPHAPLANLVAWQVDRSTPGLTTLQFGSPSFDVSFQEIFATWISGGCLIVLSEAIKRDPTAILELIEQEKVQRLFLPFVALEALAEAAVTSGRIPRSLEDIVTAGEQLRVTDSVRRFFGALPGCRLDNQYGPTETHVVTALALEGNAASWPELPTIGRPIANVQIHLLDAALRPVPVGVPADIWIAGACLADGYWRQPERTAERFRVLSIDGRDTRAYLSGDRGRYRADGSIEFLGRGDDQVKIRGFRVEPGEVEIALERLAGVRQAAVVAQPHAGTMRLLAFYVPSTSPAPEGAELRQALQKEVPDYLVPAMIVALDALPKTPSGKVDRRRLLDALPTEHARSTRAVVAPSTESEEKIAEIWKSVLGLSEVSVTDSFFDVGGHSLAALRVFSAIETTCGVGLPLSTLFRAPTIEALARLVDEAAAVGSSAEAPSRTATTERTAQSSAPERQLVSRYATPTKRVIGLQADAAGDEVNPVFGVLESDTEGTFTCETTETQQGLLFLERLYAGLPTYSIPVALWLRGPLDRDALQRSVTWMEARHEALRTSFDAFDGDGRPVARIHRLPCLTVEYDDARLASDPIAYAEHQATDVVRKPFDLARPPLWRVRVTRAGPDLHMLVIVVHHLIFDGWSQGVFFKEFGAAYDAFTTGTGPAPAPASLQHADGAIWQRAYLTPEVRNQELSYWRESLAGAPPETELPFDRPRRSLPSGQGDTVTWSLSPDVTESIRRLARSEAATTFMVVAAVVNILLARMTGQTDVVIGAPAAGRLRRELDDTIGFFTNTVALRTQLLDGPGFREVVRRVRTSTLGALDHQAVSFQRVVEALGAERHGTRHPLFQVMCSYVQAPETLLKLFGLDVRPISLTTGTAKFDITFEFTERSDRIDGTIEFSTDVLDASTIRRWIDRFNTLVVSALEAPDAPYSSLSLLSADDLAIVRAVNATDAAFERTSTLSEAFEAQVRRTPRHVAVVCGDERVTYEDLDGRANRVARLLQARGVTAGVPVGVALHRSTDLLVAILGILKAGGAYVPLDLTYPIDRLAFMLADAGTALVVTLTSHASVLPSNIPTVSLDDPRLDLAAQPDVSLPQTATSESPAYIMYTSGSTGTPKGVCVPHRAVLRLVRGTTFVPWTDVTAILQLASVSFDASTFEIWGALLNGSRSVIVADRFVEFDAVEQAIRRNSVDCVWLTAALFNTIIDTRPGLLNGVKWVLTGGEALSVPHVRRALSLLPGTQLINGYGPTETTTFACCYQIPSGVEESATSIPIGRPIENTTVHVLDVDGSRVPVGVAGELYIGGAGVALGYLNQPELTAERFVADPFDTTPGARLYRTGDLVRLQADGILVFLGRLDRQVKIRGFRIELGEVEAVLGRHAAVRQCVVIVREDTAGERRLVAYVEADASAFTDAVFRAHLEATLPSYMIPSTLVVMPRLPLTSNGKIDQRQLPDDAPSAGIRPGKANRPPATETERKIAAIWKSVLGMSDVSVTADFFDLGGHSLAALRVFSAIESAFGVSLPLSTLLRAPTIELIAKLVEAAAHPGAAPTWPALVTINEAEGPPLVCVHSLSGDILEYRDLARWLGPAQHVIGVQATLTDDLDRVYESVESTAAAYVAELRTLQPTGPYYLCGWSSGGIVALEMAQQLLAAGQRVALLAIIDTAPVGVPVPAQPVARRVLRQLANVPRWVRDDAMSASPADLMRRIGNRVSLFARRLLHADAPPVTVRDVVNFPSRSGRWEQFVQAHFRAIQKYRASRYPGRVSLFHARTHPLLWLNDSDRVWAQMAHNVDVYLIAGTHFTIVKEPRVEHLARAIATAIAGAGRRDA